MMTTKAAPRLAAGDIMPHFTLPQTSGDKSFDNRADEASGKPLVLAFGPKAAAALRGQADAFAAAGAHAFAVLREGENAAAPALADRDGRFTQYCVGDDGGFVIVRRNGHVGSIDKPSEAAVEHALKAVEAMRAEPRPAERQAPVLFVPDVLSHADCQRLMTVYNMDGNVFVEPGHGAQNQKTDYKMRIPEYGRKDRIDHWIVNSQTMGFINDRLKRRLFPEIERAFQYKVTKHERYRIGCYEGERGGFLHGHRDNSEARVAHRRFACSINLNAEDYEGGELAFPEFGGHRFSPRTGEAAVFSSSLLHEPLHVTKGRRLVLLAFLFGDT